MHLNRHGAQEREEHAQLTEKIMERYDAMTADEQDELLENLKRIKRKKVILGSELAVFSPGI